jgi:hypothetical protein
MDAFKLLKTDHKKVSQLFEKIESASGAAAKSKLFSELKGELDVHAHIEEKFLYPALENKEPSREITLEAYEEHKVVKELLAELATQPPNEEWDAKLTVLKENVEHHVEEEEGELFDKAEKVLSEEQIDRLGAEMEAEKAAQMNGNAPRSTSAKKAAANPREAKTAESPGVLQRLAKLVGIGATAPAQKSASKKTAKKSAKKATKKTAGKGVKKTAAKTASKSTAAKKSAKRATKSGPSKKSAASPRKSAKKSASRKK